MITVNPGACLHAPTNPLYRIFVPASAAGANKYYFDLFNEVASGLNLEFLHVEPVVSGAAAVTGTLAVDLFLMRTTAVGTGGTAATYEGTVTTAMTISGVNGSDPLTAPQISGRFAPSGGATAGAVLSWTSLFSEETNAGTYTPSEDLAQDAGGVILVRPGTGVKVRQGSVASVGNIGFNIIARVTRR